MNQITQLNNAIILVDHVLKEVTVLLIIVLLVLKDIIGYIVKKEIVLMKKQVEKIHIMMKKMIHIKNVMINVKNVRELVIQNIIIVLLVQVDIISFSIKLDNVFLNQKNVNVVI